MSEYRITMNRGRDANNEGVSSLEEGSLVANDLPLDRSLLIVGFRGFVKRTQEAMLKLGNLPETPVSKHYEVLHGIIWDYNTLIANSLPEGSKVEARYSIPKKPTPQQ